MLVTRVDVPAVLARFHRRHPKAHVSLHIGAGGELVDHVRAGDLGIAFLGIPETASPKGANSRELTRERLVAVAVAPDRPPAGEESVTLGRLAGETFIDLPARTAGRARSGLAFAAAGLTRRVAFEVAGADYLARLVGTGLGVALLPPSCTARLGSLAAVAGTDAPTRAEHLVRAPHPGPAAAAFLDLIDGGGEG
ncbi:LysR substrate-binding domain-containing protein [Streptomyces zhihengii]|uniref:LysR substrate-binding domain-containing protein n=1 Tax=Streptomyces zhihengii TaxID=1818004 RepID=A0ABS2UML4_9ACTN|nr:LysR substrate-binding domain-containing protein [Streptomyces zhihengii]MBM9618759.1 hypothetical protein [Streptomyces zhihengii]